MEKSPRNNTYTFSQEEVEQAEERIRGKYAEQGRLHEYETFRKIQELERQKLRIEHEIAMAQQDLERKQRIAKFEEKQSRGEQVSKGASLLYQIDKELDAELQKTQEDYNKEELQERGSSIFNMDEIQEQLRRERAKTQEDYDRE